MMDRKSTCPVCGERPEFVFSRVGSYVPTKFEFYSCGTCQFRYIANPCEDYERLYDMEYYQGRGADPSIDYLYELENPYRAVRRYEWEGITTVLKQFGMTPDSSVLDYGCGNGGLVRYMRQSGHENAVGFDEGAIVPVAVQEYGIPILKAEELDSYAGHFDFVTAIEVLEHIPEPIPVLEGLMRLLRPGGTLFYTTGNAAAVGHARFPKWRYVMPEVHCSYYEPKTLQQAFEQTGFTTTFPGLVAGWDRIYEYKVLKGLRFRKTSRLFDLVPWRGLVRRLDRRFMLAQHPIAHRP